MMRGDGGRGRLCWHCGVTVHGFTVRLVAWRTCIGLLDRGKVACAPAYARKSCVKRFINRNPTVRMSYIVQTLLPLPAHTKAMIGNEAQVLHRPHDRVKLESVLRDRNGVNVDRIACCFATGPPATPHRYGWVSGNS